MSTNNAITVIAPYWWRGTWVFDDPEVDLVREPFVAGVPAIIDHLVADIPNARGGVRLLFSSTPFPGYQQLAELDRELGAQLERIGGGEPAVMRSARSVVEPVHTTPPCR